MRRADERGRGPIPHPGAAVAMSDPEARKRILAATRLPKRALSRVAAGRSILGSATWRKVLEAIGGGAGQ